MAVDPTLQWPGCKVYFTAVEWAGDLYFGVTNVGGSPTFRQEGPTVETHILDFHGDLYQKKIRVYFLEELRETASFSNPGELKKQIARDIRRATRMAAAGYRWPGGSGRASGQNKTGKFIYI